MKIISLDNIWYFQSTKGDVSYPFTLILENVVNSHLEKPYYSVKTDPENPNHFTVMTTKAHSFPTYFKILIVPLPKPETDPLIIFYHVVHKDLAKRFQEYLSPGVYSPSKVLLFEGVPTAEDIQTLVSQFEN